MLKFNFTLKYVLEIKIGKINRLSRRLDYKIGIENNNNNQELIKEEWICSLVEVVVERLEVDIIKKNKNS